MPVSRFAVVILAASAVASAHADQWTKNFAVNGRPEVHVETNDASVEITNTSLTQIAATVITNGWRISDREVRVDARQSGNTVELQVRVPREHHWFGPNFRSVRVELQVPKQCNLDVHTEDGNIKVENASGDVRLVSGDGNIEAASLEGRVSANSGDGNLIVHEAKGELRFSTGDGRVEVDSGDGTLSAHSGDGNVRATGRFDQIDIRTNDGSVDIEARQGSQTKQDWHLRSGDGSIVLRVPANFSAEVDAHTGDGEIKSELPITSEGRFGDTSTVRGKINGGGGMLELRTADGSIRIERL